MRNGIAKTFVPALAFGAAVSLTGPAFAQATHRAPAIDIAITYETVHSDHVANGNSFFQQGGAAEIHAHLFGGLGVVASLTGEHAGRGATGAAPISLISTVFGPRYTFAPMRRASFFIEGMAGEVNAFQSTFPAAAGSATPRTSASSLAVLTGGGIDWNVSRHLAIRAVQADWLHTQLPNGGDNTQNNLRLGAGLVIKFGR